MPFVSDRAFLLPCPIQGNYLRSSTSKFLSFRASSRGKKLGNIKNSASHRFVVSFTDLRGTLYCWALVVIENWCNFLLRTQRLSYLIEDTKRNFSGWSQFIINHKNFDPVWVQIVLDNFAFSCRTKVVWSWGPSGPKDNLSADESSYQLHKLWRQDRWQLS